MRPAFEKLLCRTHHKWGDWDITDKSNIHRHCLRDSCDEVRAISYGEYVMLAAWSKIILKQAKQFCLSTKFLKSPTEGKMRWRRYRSLGNTNAD